MTNTHHLLILVGSSRRGSLNRQLAENVASIASAQGLRTTLPDIRALDIPIMDQDLEATDGIPAGARQLRQALEDADALIVCSPEYNGFPTPLLKNALDWMSRPDGDIAGLDAFRGKPALALSASPGALGGLRSLALTRQLLDNLGMLVMPEKLSVGSASKAFNTDGSLANERQQHTLSQAISTLTDRLRRLQS